MTTFSTVNSVCLIILLNLINLSLGVKIANLLPHYCGQNIESQQEFKTIPLNLTNQESSFLNLGASILQGIEIPSNYKCYLIVTSPNNTGLILTFRKAALNDKDVITFRSGNNPGIQVWKKQSEESPQYNEVVTIVNKDSSSIIIKYEPTIGVSPFNAGFDLAVTVYTEKEIDCGSQFDCNNGRCVSPIVLCDGYNNCGNDLDEYSCPGHISWWMIGILIPIAIIVVVLAIFVWIRMSKG